MRLFSLLILLTTVFNQCKALHAHTHPAVQLIGKAFILNTHKNTASSALCKRGAVTDWKIARADRQLGDVATIWLLKNDRSQQIMLILYSNPNKFHPKVGVFRRFEEGLYHTQLFRIYIDIL